MGKLYKKKLIELIYLIDKYSIKNKNQFLFLSFPDVSDNSFAMFKYLYTFYKEKKENKKFIWLLSYPDKANEYKRLLIENMKLKECDFNHIIFTKKNSIKGLYYYFRSKYVFYTHGMYPGVKIPKNHIVVNLWHGMPLKNFGNINASSSEYLPFSSYILSTSIFFQKYMAKAFATPFNNVLVTGQPRNDLLSEKYSCLLKFGLKKEKYKKIFLWTPTYRQAIVGYSSLDGGIYDGLPIISENYEKLNSYLVGLESYMIVKLHPMDILNNNKFDDFSNLLFLKNEDLENKYCQLYEILSDIDVLITDFSSIYIDFLLLDRPIGFAMDDFDSYGNSRGFIMENPKDYMPGEFIVSQNELFYFLNKCVEEKDDFKEHRKRITNLYHDVKSNFSETLWIKIIELET
jgi:CDP-glycerol glycerophosphotransferase (TagB/SpsB family)